MPPPPNEDMIPCPAERAKELEKALCNQTRVTRSERIRSPVNVRQAWGKWGLTRTPFLEPNLVLRMLVFPSNLFL